MSAFTSRLLLSLGLLHTIACGEEEKVDIDLDNDGIVDSEDCDDQNAAINASATDTVGDGIDQNCDGVDGTDKDGDGLASIESGGVDCDDDNPDEEVSAESIFYADKDGDGFGNAENSTSACEMPFGYVDNADDCNDEFRELNPNAVEVCDGLDNDCDGAIDDEDDSATSLYVTYTDSDGDGYGDPTTELMSCAVPDSNVSVAGDCDDSDESIHPEKDEGPADGVDQNCDGVELCYEDQDGDGFGGSFTVDLVDDGTGTFDCVTAFGMTDNDDDCEDTYGTIHPDAVEVCDEIDNDCDGLVDDEDETVDLSTGGAYFLDNDGDGFGAQPIEACVPASNMITVDGDCDDTASSINPFQTDIVGDGFDQNCDGVDGTDSDGDGFASSVSGGTDCDDQNEYINPDAQEICSGVDEDCDGYIDDLDDSIDLADTVVMYPDADGDGFGDMSMPYDSCGNTEGYVEDGTDCNDADAMTYPGAAFFQDATACLTDADADGWGVGYVTGDTCFTIEMTDSFGDGWNGNSIDIYEDGAFIDSVTLTSGSEGAVEHCAVENSNVEFYFYEGSYVYEVGFELFTPEGTSMVAVAEGDAIETGLPVTSGSAIPTQEYVVADCDDLDYNVNPDASETCDGMDNNCDGTIDEGATTTYYTDIDGDGFGSQSVDACAQPAMTALVDGDCNDLDYTINPAASETCDELDNNCDGTVDEGVTVTFYVDGDGDGYGVSGQTVEACTVPAGAATIDGDCDDADAISNPGAAEQCDGVDNNCDGTVDEGMYTMLFADEDGDGYGNPSNFEQRCIDDVDPTWTGDASDCDDSSAETYPGAAELEATSGCMADEDGDGYGDVNPPSYVVPGTDCDDGSASAYPGSAELESTTDCMEDTDGDGYGNGTVQSPVVAGSDCQDTLSAINPMSTDIAGDAIDQNCDGVDGTDFDGDGDPSVISGGSDCDDNDPTVETLDVDGDGASTCDMDCNDSDATTVGDDDGDGFYVCEDDCDDGDANINPDADELWYDGVDQNCDNANDYDQDGDGEESSEHGGTDCDDLNVDVNTADDDGDGFTSCEGDCWDSAEDADSDGVIDSSMTYPGAAFNESTTECLSDNDGDGYAPMADGSICYTFETFDAYGDGWNGNGLEIYESGMVVQTIENENLDSTLNNNSGGEYNTHEYCVGPMVSHVDIAFVDGQYNTEIAFELFSPYGELIASGYGDGTTDLIVNGTTYVDGDIVFAFDVMGMDCDDDDANVYGGSDNDGDGYSACFADCDDYDSAINNGASETWYDGIDQDCDGLSDYDQDGDGDDDIAYGGTDCDDTDSSVSGLDVDGDGESSCAGDCDDDDDTINSSATEIWYDGVDQDCDGMSDYDQDGDGYDDVAYGGDDCDDLDSTTYGDDDGDGYLECVDDCDDGDSGSNPAGTEVCGDGIDQDCDGVDLNCQRTKIMTCGSSGFLISNLQSYMANTYSFVSSCSPDDDTQAMFVTRTGVINSSWATYIEEGGIIITEFSISDDVFSSVFSSVSQGARYGSCSDNFTEAYQFTSTDPFWTDLGWSGGQPGNGNTGCGYSVSSYPGITPIAGWNSSAVSTAYRDSGAGRLWLADYDWQDGSSSTRTQSVLAYMAENKGE